QHIDDLKARGAHIMYGIDAQAKAKAARPEPMKTSLGLKAIRRQNANGYHYFIANLTPNDIHQKVTLTVPFNAAKWFNPLNGDITDATFDAEGIDICLRSGESMILQTFDTKMNSTNSQASTTNSPAAITLNGPWTLSFIDETPKVDKTYTLDKLQTWETLDEQTRVTMGTGVYTTHFKMSKKEDPSGPWTIDLGDVRESARVYINGQFIGCAWSVPFVLDTRGALKVGDNELRIEVTNLPANRISELDRQGVKWRKMEEINVVDINYKKTLYDQWEPMPSGLNSSVRLIRK
ncbi:MAG: glycosyl hydrolase family 2, partial [Prevotella sp.]|nr:glycosyl hydrolase family 2 [Prevotella sp.]